ncbi:MAG: phosphoglucosamine mutase [Clostridiales bacterium]|nr:phosphoglucosamine mutase [Clostridiales bacterium]
MNKYFGTDGIRGKYGDNLDAALAYKTGRAVAAYFGQGEAYIARDTRVSGPEIEEALVKGITDGGMNAVLLGVIPTPAVAVLSLRDKATCGIMVSASHNPPEYNGIKIFDGNGTKLTEEQEGSIEYYIDNQPQQSKDRGSSRVLCDAHERYVQNLVSAASADLSGLKVRLDCGYGAAGTVAKEAFSRLGAQVEIENCSGRGEKINCGCGALHPDYVRNSNRGTDCRLGFAFDGDADRLSVVVNDEIIDGDSVLYNISREMELHENIVVGTILSNSALERQLAEDGKRLVRTPVGDKYICDLMFRKGYSLGGEQSGHYIVYPAATTGDGILSAICFCKSLYKKGKLGKVLKLPLVPQKAIAEYATPDIVYKPEMVALVEKYTEALAPHGRLIVRYSGTEPKVRVMVESEDAAVVDEVLRVFKEFIRGQKR